MSNGLKHFLIFRFLSLALVALSMIPVAAQADNITIWDHNNSSNSCSTGSCEDDETEPGTIATQVWDLEGFLLSGNSLSMVGGFKFDTGVQYNSKWYKSGHVFIDETGDAKYGKNWANANPVFTGLNNSGWDYAIVLDFTTLQYSVYAINSGTAVLGTTDISNSQPWRINTTGLTAMISSVPFGFAANVTDSGLSSWSAAAHTHYRISGIDLGFLGTNQQFTVHFTLECGNDNLIGQGATAVPEPATVLLVGIGIAGLAAVRFSRK